MLGGVLRGSKQGIDINSNATIWAASLLGVVSVLSFIVQPGLVQGFVSELGLSEPEANDLAFLEMIGFAVGSVFVLIFGRRVSWVKILAVGLILSAIGNFLSAVVSEPDFFKLCRFGTGVGEGFVMSMSFTIISLTEKPERNFSIFLVFMLTYGAVGLWVMPAAFEVIGLNGIFIIWSIATLGAVATLRYVPHSVDSRVEPSPTSVQLGWPLLTVALFGFFLYNSAIGIAWANLFLIGMEITPDAQIIANGLLLAQFAAIGGALVAYFTEAKLGRWLPIIIGIFGGAGSIALLLGEPGYTLFVIAVSGFNFLWNFVLPYILSSITDMVRKGEIMTAAVTMQVLGLGFGPFIAARILGDVDGGGFQTVLWTTIAMFIMSFLLLSIAKIARRRAYALSLQAE